MLDNSARINSSDTSLFVLSVLFNLKSMEEHEF
jgi:hypothetical protein